jgi:hypothetical protein
MAEQTDEQAEAELAAILRRPPDDPERVNLESWIESCEFMTLYAKHLVPQEATESCQPRNCEQCGEPFTPARNDAGALYCSKACRQKSIGKRALARRRLDRRRSAAEPESQPT